ncbi:unnamed protein product [Hermetia illucens]|uniref:NADH dehydrogenase [ubiquinone] 1 alpha subcomplex subunit 12 n=1 Tax=Hermetia illucens TaxID=343691 RepID=A0A7R8US57_HERIL|nr:probable NADH dehydrogenase [ubiquinone] 1 alpha subcomplex subunit 12 [Hermetia illucens]CAD7085073.1 unnamed protein product [Hermetia illucens]
MAAYFGFDRISQLLRIIRKNGGFLSSFKKLYRFDDLKMGCFVGCDKYGNRYYENSYYFYGRNRWVEYADHVGMNYDGSQIPAEWFGWMHYKTDLTPCEDCSRPQYKWMTDHSENLTGTVERYMPYSTTRAKIEPWNPKKISNKSNGDDCM